MTINKSKISWATFLLWFFFSVRLNCTYMNVLPSDCPRHHFLTDSLIASFQKEMKTMPRPSRQRIQLIFVDSLFTHSFKYLLNTNYYVANTVLGRAYNDDSFLPPWFPAQKPHPELECFQTSSPKIILPKRYQFILSKILREKGIYLYKYWHRIKVQLPQ